MPWNEPVSNLHASLEPAMSRRQRLEEVSRRLLGSPYCNNPLGGAPGELDPPRFSLDCFDCVTYIETAIAIALSASAGEYVQQIIMLRYREGSQFWADRLHYFSHWLESNEAKGMLEILVPGGPSVRERKALAAVPGLPILSKEIVAHPWDISAVGASAGIIGFVSPRADLDVFHVGILAERARLLRHASAAAGGVIEEPLGQFLGREEGRGILLARLTEGGDRRG